MQKTWCDLFDKNCFLNSSNIEIFNEAVKRFVTHVLLNSMGTITLLINYAEVNAFLVSFALAHHFALIVGVNIYIQMAAILKKTR